MSTAISTATKKKPSKRENQAETVLAHLRTGACITQKIAREYGIERLAARIFDLKKQGFSIRREMVWVGSGEGRTKVAEYTLDRQFQLPL